MSAKLRGSRTEIPYREFEDRSEIVNSKTVSGYFCRFPIFAQLKTNFHRILTGVEINHESEGNR